MDLLKRAWYQIAFERDFLKKKGGTFQDFFSEIMEKRYKGDFIRVRPWGNVGDRKNDGYLPSKRLLFQVYAPNELAAAEAVKKIDEDFHGALPHWKDHFGTWVFVHNSRIGLGPDVTKTLLDLAKPDGPKVTSWGFEELCAEALSLEEDDLVSLLGFTAPTDAQARDVSFNDLKLVLMSIARQPVTPDREVRPVPPEKLAESNLSEGPSFLLKLGMLKSDRVAKFFESWPDPQFGNQVVESFRQEYLILRRTAISPDEAFQELLAFAGGLDGKTSEHPGAVLAVLAYLFEECEIFGKPPEEDSP